MDEKYVGGHNTREIGNVFTSDDLEEAERVLRHQCLRRRIDAERRGDRAPPRDRRPCFHVGQRLPAPRGHLAPHAAMRSPRRSPTYRRTRRRACLVRTPPRSTVRRREAAADCRTHRAVTQRTCTGHRRWRRADAGRGKVGRPARIDRTAIAEAVLDLGLDGISMKAVADHLGVSVAGLYHHVANRRELLVLAAEHSLARRRHS